MNDDYILLNCFDTREDYQKWLDEIPHKIIKGDQVLEQLPEKYRKCVQVSDFRSEPMVYADNSMMATVGDYGGLPSSPLLRSMGTVTVTNTAQKIDGQIVRMFDMPTFQMHLPFMVGGNDTPETIAARIEKRLDEMAIIV